MSHLYVSEHKMGDSGMLQQPSNAEQVLPIEIGAEAVSEPFGAETHAVLMHATENCSVAFGTKPDADPKKGFMKAGETRQYSVFPGHRLAVIAAEEF